MSQKEDTWALNRQGDLTYCHILWNLFQVMNIPEQNSFPLVQIL